MDTMSEAHTEGDWAFEEIRVMGVLMEKAITTPDQYPLSLNSLVLGCNQSTSRDPVTELDETEVEEALIMLRDRKLVYRVDQAGARVAKFQHRLFEQWELQLPELAVLTVLMLRGPQTVGQLRQRTERLYLFRDVDQVRDTLQGMMTRDVEPEQLVKALPIQHGSKECRYAHLLCPVPVDSAVVEVSSGQGNPQSSGETLPGLREKVTQLENELEQLRQEFNEFKSQF